jgi:hypothetical protein
LTKIQLPVDFDQNFEKTTAICGFWTLGHPQSGNPGYVPEKKECTARFFVEFFRTKIPHKAIKVA